MVPPEPQQATHDLIFRFVPLFSVAGPFFVARYDESKPNQFSANQPFIMYVDIGLSFDASSEMYGGKLGPCGAGGGRARRTGRYI